MTWKILPNEWLKRWAACVTGLPGFWWAAAGRLPQSPEDSEGEGAKADRLPEGAGKSWAGVSETQQSKGRSPGGTRYKHTHVHKYCRYLKDLKMSEEGLLTEKWKHRALKRHLFSQDVSSLKRTATRTTSRPATHRWETKTLISFSAALDCSSARSHVMENIEQEDLTSLRVTHKWFALKMS